MEEQEVQTTHATAAIWIAVVVSLVIGGVGGYFIGSLPGEGAPTSDQIAQEEAAKEAAQEEIADKANPFSDVTNPLEDGYENPFDTNTSNPFR